MSMWRRRLEPRPGELIDAGASLALVALATVGFRAAFGGTQVLVVGLGGALLGAAVGYAAGKLRWDPIVWAASVVIVFFAIGGALVVPEETLAGIPTPSSFAALVDGAVNGWSQLITTLPPAGSAGNLLAVPWLCSTVAAAATSTLALRTPLRGTLLVLPIGVLVAGVLFGTDEPASLLLEGALFAALAVVWVANRHERGRVILRATSLQRQAFASIVLVALAGTTALMVGPWMREHSGRERFVLRDRTEPTFDPRDYPSPLVGFRGFVSEEERDQPVLRVRGLQEGDMIRLGVLDTYDGIVWAVGGRERDGSGRFLRVGERLPGVDGATRTIEIEVVDLPGVWVPTAEQVQAVQWTGTDDARADAVQDRLRVNTSNGMIVLPDGRRQNTLVPGDTYRLAAVDRATPDPDAVSRADFDTSVVLPAMVDVPPAIRELAAQHVGVSATPFEQVRALEEWLAQGFYSDGGSQSQVPPGHGLFRLEEFLGASQLEGNAEQYAAAMAVMTRSLGIPSRIVVGFQPSVVDPNGVVEVVGADVDAWVEVAFEGVGWVAFHPTPPETRVLQDRPPPPEQIEEPDQLQPPPPVTAPEQPEVDTDDARPPRDEEQREEQTSSGGGVPGYVIVVGTVTLSVFLLLAAPVLLILYLKARRRRLRRSRPSPAHRVAGAWDEVIDRARDSGRRVPRHGTRRETAAALDSSEVAALAADADRVVFGHGEPDDGFVDAFWHRAEIVSRKFVDDASRLARLRATLSTASLRCDERAKERV